jgi:hypothetical protein
MRVCVCTSNRIDSEPRAPRHAVAIVNSKSDVEIILLDCAPAGDMEGGLKDLDDVPRLSRVTHYFGHRRNGVLRLIFGRILQKAARMVFRVFDLPHSCAITPYMMGVKNKLIAVRANIYFAHGIEMLYQTWEIHRLILTVN